MDNNSNSGAEYSDLQTAIDAAAAGDTLYIVGSLTTYGNATITKKLAIIGAGYKVDNQWEFPSTLGAIYLQLDEMVTPVSDPSGSYFSGLSFASIFGDPNIGSFVIERCKMSRLNIGDGTTVTVTNSILGRVEPSSSLVDIVIRNSILTGGISSYNSGSNVLIDHCLFTDLSLEYGQLRYVVITNSIMYSVSTGGVEYTTFNNNMSIGGTETAFIYDTNTGGGNFPNTNPEFQVIDGATFSFTDDFRLQNTSPGKNAATDGTDIGIYGGSYPFPVGGVGEFLMAAPPRIPQIYEMNILNSSLPEGGSLEVNVKARKQN